MSKLFDYPAPLWRVRSVAALTIVAISIVVWGSYVLFRIATGASQEWLTWALRSWNMFVVRCSGIHFEVSGSENHDPSVPSLVVSNHQSLFDIPAAFFALGGNLRMVAKKELFQIPIFGRAIGLSGFIPVDRNNRNSGREATRMIAEHIKAGVHIWIAPEGTRSPDGQLQDFKKGSFSVALDNGIPVQPLLVVDSWRACPKGSLLPRPGTVIHIRVLPRIQPADMAHIKDRGELAAVTRAKLSQALNESTQSIYGTEGTQNA